jgi:hypothetical protein
MISFHPFRAPGTLACKRAASPKYLKFMKEHEIIGPAGENAGQYMLKVAPF